SGVEDRVHETEAVDVVVDVVEEERVQDLPREVRDGAVVRLAVGGEESLLLRRRHVAESDDQEVIRAEAERRGERRVETEPSVAEEAAVDPRRREEKRDRGRGQRVLGGEARPPGEADGIT